MLDKNHHNFSIEDLYVYLHERIGINRASLSWYLFKLVDDNALVRTGRGMYGKVIKQLFSPNPADKVIEVYELLPADFPFTKFCVYQGEIIDPLQYHLSSNRIIYVEIERDTFGLSQRIVRACRELGVFTVEQLLVHLRRFRFSRLYGVRNFGRTA